ncbi:MAG TPA: hypothetical protein PLG04_00260 [Anaerolineaceae bacterium]|nr:hypothetical protein [Anaerolineaceae bacterium]
MYYDDDNILYFSDWRKDQGYYSRAKTRNMMLSNGYSQKQFEKEWDKIEKEFWDYCDDFDLEGDMDE